MIKAEKRRFKTKVFLNGVMAGLLFLSLMVLCPSFLLAEGDSGNDVKLQNMQVELMACMQPGVAGQAARLLFSQKYNVPLDKLNSNVPDGPPTSNGGWSYANAQWICGIEMFTVIGFGVWDNRRIKDECTKSANDYCVQYSHYCNHYTWEQYCLARNDRTACNRLW